MTSQMAESTKAMRRAIFERDVLPTWKNRLLCEIGPDDLRVLCAGVASRGAPATAIHVHDMVKQIYELRRTGFTLLNEMGFPLAIDTQLEFDVL